MPQFALLLGIHHSSVYRWEKSPKAPPIERYSRRVLAVLHLLRKDKEAKAEVSALVRQHRDIEALHLIFTYATKHQQVLAGSAEAPALPEARRKPVVRPEPRQVLTPVLLREEEDEGEKVEDDTEQREPEELPDHLLEVFMLGRWCDYGKHGERRAKTMARHHESKGRQVRLTRVAVVTPVENDAEDE